MRSRRCLAVRHAAVSQPAGYRSRAWIASDGRGAAAGDTGDAAPGGRHVPAAAGPRARGRQAACQSLGRRPVRGREPPRGGRPPRPRRAEVVRREAFVEPHELEPEQRALYRAGVRGYLAEFGDAPGPGRRSRMAHAPSKRSVSTSMGDAGLALERPDGSHEIRILKLGGRRTGAPLLDPVELRCVARADRGVGARTIS